MEPLGNSQILKHEKMFWYVVDPEKFPASE